MTTENIQSSIRDADRRARIEQVLAKVADLRRTPTIKGLRDAIDLVQGILPSVSGYPEEVQKYTALLEQLKVEREEVLEIEGHVATAQAVQVLASELIALDRAILRNIPEVLGRDPTQVRPVVFQKYIDTLIQNQSNRIASRGTVARKTGIDYLEPEQIMAARQDFEAACRILTVTDEDLQKQWVDMAGAGALPPLVGTIIHNLSEDLRQNQALAEKRQEYEKEANQTGEELLRDVQRALGYYQAAEEARHRRLYRDAYDALLAAQNQLGSEHKSRVVEKLFTLLQSDLERTQLADAEAALYAAEDAFKNGNLAELRQQLTAVHKLIAPFGEDNKKKLEERARAIEKRIETDRANIKQALTTLRMKPRHSHQATSDSYETVSRLISDYPLEEEPIKLRNEIIEGRLALIERDITRAIQDNDIQFLKDIDQMITAFRAWLGNHSEQASQIRLERRLRDAEAQSTQLRSNTNQRQDSHKQATALLSEVEQHYRDRKYREAKRLLQLMRRDVDPFPVELKNSTDQLERKISETWRAELEEDVANALRRIPPALPDARHALERLVAEAGQEDAEYQALNKRYKQLVAERDAKRAYDIGSYGEAFNLWLESGSEPTDWSLHARAEATAMLEQQQRWETIVQILQGARFLSPEERRRLEKAEEFARIITEERQRREDLIKADRQNLILAQELLQQGNLRATSVYLTKLREANLPELAEELTILMKNFQHALGPQIDDQRRNAQRLLRNTAVQADTLRDCADTLETLNSLSNLPDSDVHVLVHDLRKAYAMVNSAIQEIAIIRSDWAEQRLTSGGISGLLANISRIEKTFDNVNFRPGEIAALRERISTDYEIQTQADNQATALLQMLQTASTDARQIVDRMSRGYPALLDLERKLHKETEALARNTSMIIPNSWAERHQRSYQVLQAFAKRNNNLVQSIRTNVNRSEVDIEDHLRLRDCFDHLDDVKASGVDLERLRS